MPNEVVIHVVSRNEVKKGFDSSKADVEKFAEQSSDIYQRKFSQRMEQLGRNLTTPLANSGKEMGVRLGNASAGEITRTITARISKDLPESITRSLTESNSTIVNESRKTGDSIGNAMGDSAGRSMSQRLTDTITRVIRTKIRRVGDEISADSGHAGERIGEDISRTIHTKIKDKIKTSVDVDTDGSFLSKAESAGKMLGDKIGDGVGGSLSSFFSGDLISLLVKAIAGGALAAALAPVLGAAVSSALLLGLGGGVLLAGVMAAFKDPRLSGTGKKMGGAAKELKDQVGGVLAVLGAPLRAPIADTMEKLSKLVKSLTPDMDRLGKAFAPIVGALGTGLVSLLQNAMPGILKAVEASLPLFDTLAKHMPEIGTAIGRFFELIAEQGDDANVFFGDMLTLVEKLIPFIGGLISAFTSAYSVVHNFTKNGIALFKALWGGIKTGIDVAKVMFLQFALKAIDAFGLILAGASSALSWIPGMGSKLKSAEAKFNSFRKGVNSELNKIKDRHVKVAVSVTGLQAAGRAIANVANQIARLSTGYAHGGIIGAAAGGGPRNGMTLVGENGPELVSLPTGSTVHSNGDSRRMAAGLGGDSGGYTIILKPAEGVGSELVNAVLSVLRVQVDRNGQGRVQTLLGRPGVAA